MEATAASVPLVLPPPPGGLGTVMVLATLPLLAGAALPWVLLRPNRLAPGGYLRLPPALLAVALGLALLPEDAGLIVAHGFDAEVLREAPAHPLAPARRRALLQRFAATAALRLACAEDPEGMRGLRGALRAE